MQKHKIPVFFHGDQLIHKPLFEWAFGEKIEHPETTARAESIRAALLADTQRFDLRAPVRFPLNSIRELHDKDLVTLYKSALSLPMEKTFYPSVFPRKDTARIDPTNLKHAGFFCADSGTPLNATTWAAAAWSAACAEEAALLVERGKSRLTYALCRPPGHHASREQFGGYCYLNNAAIAASRLKKLGRVVILDIDFHHGNGTQGMFYLERGVFVISIHGDPSEYYPFFSGFASEKGASEGTGFNLNIPLPCGVDGQEYLRVLEKQVLPAIRKYAPAFLVVSAGFDTYVADPVGAFALETEDYHSIGGRLAALGLPTVVVQEGGYAAESLGRNVASLLGGFWDDLYGSGVKRFHT